MSYNLEIVQGSDYTRTFTVYNIHKAILNLTGYTITAQIRRNHTSSESYSFQVTVIDAVAGKVKLFLPHATTSILSSKYEYDIFLTDPDNKKYMLEYGLINIKSNITR